MSLSLLSWIHALSVVGLCLWVYSLQREVRAQQGIAEEWETGYRNLKRLYDEKARELDEHKKLFGDAVGQWSPVPRGEARR